MCSQNRFLGLNLAGMEFFPKKSLKTVFGPLFPTEKVFSSYDTQFCQKWLCPQK